MALKTERTEGGEWKVKGLPFIVCKSPYEPRWGDYQEWIICAADEADRVLGMGYRSKAHALECLEEIVLGAKGEQ